MKCHHGLSTEACIHCRSTNSSTPPVKRPTLHIKGIVSSSSLKTLGFKIISAQQAKSDKTVLDKLDASVTHVHINGHAYLWLLEKIINKVPNLKRITVIPSVLKVLGDNHFGICKKSNVELASGYWSPEKAWKGNALNRHPAYEAERRFFLELSGEQRDLFDELLLFKFEEALMVARYYRLEDEEPITLRRLATEFGFRHAATAGSTRVNAVIRYLDPDFNTGIDSTRKAKSIETHVQKLRNRISGHLHHQAMLEDVVRQLEIDQIPDGLPLSLLDRFEAIVRALRSDDMVHKLKQKSHRLYSVLALRYGLEDYQFKTLSKVGELLNGITGERVRQLESEALDFLGIADEDD